LFTRRPVRHRRTNTPIEHGETDASTNDNRPGGHFQSPVAGRVALWEHLQSADYRANWELWPGKGEKYEGTEPHGMLLTTYLNEVAYDALTNAAGRMPADAIIVKENYMPDGTLAAITTMYKVEGYNAEAGDWHWVKFLADGSIDMDGMAQGKVAMCIGCHTGKADNDYVFTGSLSGGGD
jgi:hypothetical protein